MLLRKRGDAAVAEESFRAALRVDPGHKSAHYGLGAVLRERGAEAKAAESFRAALRVDPGHKYAHNGLGVAFRERGDAGCGGVPGGPGCIVLWQIRGWG